MKHLFCFGFGFSSQEVAKTLLRTSEWRVTGTTRNVDKRSRMMETGVEGLIWPGTDITDALSSATHWLISTPPFEGKDPVIQWLENERVDSTWPVEWIGYFSTTAVYGDHQGRWVDENTPVSPATERGRYRAQAEQDWKRMADGLRARLYTFRLAGIYGPGRGPVEQMTKGVKRKIIKDGQYFNRIHVADIAGAVIQSINKPLLHGVYNVCDDKPERPDIIADHVAELLEMTPLEGVRYEKAELSPMARSFYGESKRASNAKLKTFLGYKLKYPDYETGFRALLTAKRNA